MKKVFSVLLMFFICGVLSAYELAGINRRLVILKEEIKGFYPGKITLKYPFGMTKRDVERETAGLKQEITELEQEKRNISDRINSHKWRVTYVSMDIQKTGLFGRGYPGATIWDSNPDPYFAAYVPGEGWRRVVPWRLNNWRPAWSEDDIRSKYDFTLNVANNVLKVYTWSPKDKSTFWGEIKLNLDPYEHTDTHTFSGNIGDYCNWEVTVKKCD